VVAGSAPTVTSWSPPPSAWASPSSSRACGRAGVQPRLPGPPEDRDRLSRRRVARQAGRLRLLRRHLGRPARRRAAARRLRRAACRHGPRDSELPRRLVGVRRRRSPARRRRDRRRRGGAAGAADLVGDRTARRAACASLRKQRLSDSQSAIVARPLRAVVAAAHVVMLPCESAHGCAAQRTIASAATPRSQRLSRRICCSRNHLVRFLLASCGQSRELTWAARHSLDRPLSLLPTCRLRVGNEQTSRDGSRRAALRDI